MAEGGLGDWDSWRCCHDSKKFCPAEGCPADYGCARDKGWLPGMPTPDGCRGVVAREALASRA